MKPTLEEIVEYANRMARGCVVLHNAAQEKVLDVLTDEQEAAHPGTGESVQGVQLVSEEAHDLSPVLQATLEDEVLLPHEKADIATNIGQVRQFAKATRGLGLTVWDGLGVREKTTESWQAFRATTIDGMTVTLNALDRLIEMIVAFLEDDGGTDPEPGDPDDLGPDSESIHPGVDYPDGGDNPMRWAVQKALSGEPHACWAHGTLSDGQESLDVFLPARETRGIALGGTNWSELAQVKRPGVGARIIRIYGHPNTKVRGKVGTKVRWNGLDYGGSMLIRYDDTWEGRVHLHDLHIECSAKNGLSGGVYGKQDKLPLEDVRMYRGGVIDGPVRCLQPISFNQCVLELYGTIHDTPDAYEHRGYTRNPKRTKRVKCRGLAGGGQTWQTVSRKSEGPQYPRALCTVEGEVMHNHHRDPSRRGTYETLAGDGHDYEYRGCLWYEILEDGRAHGEGLFVVWDGGWNKSHKLPNGHTNGTATLKDCGLFIRRPHKAPAKFHDSSGVKWDGGVIYVEPSPNRTVDIHNGFPVMIEGVNAPGALEDWLDRFPVLHGYNWEEPKIRLIDEGKVLGVISEGYERAG